MYSQQKLGCRKINIEKIHILLKDSAANHTVFNRAGRPILESERKYTERIFLFKLIYICIKIQKQKNALFTNSYFVAIKRYC
jgi:hypothetical protein